jgi:dTDP-4-amino-4,6-dideoxygalactose transaminase
MQAPPGLLEDGMHDARQTTSPTAATHVKQSPEELALFDGAPLFSPPRSTSNLVPPDPEAFFRYSRKFYDQCRYTNDGPLVQSLEGRLAKFHGAAHCVTFCSGFWALAMAMKCLALPGRSEIVMASLTYRRMADVAAWAGLVPHFCEVDPRSLAAGPAEVEACIGPDTALLMGTHPIVNCCDAPGLVELARRRQLPLLFDSVESMYETVGGRKVGSFPQAEVFSMHASKLVNGFEGGYVTTDDEHLAGRLVRMRAFGFFGQDNIEELGMNAKLNEIHAAMTLAGLDGLEEQVQRNRHRFEQYRELLRGLPGIRLVEFDAGEASSFKNILVELLDDWPLTRETTLAALNADGMLARAYYSPPLHAKPAAYRTIAGELPLTTRLAQRFVLLPCGHFVSDADTEAIVGFLRFLQAHAAAIQARRAAPAGGRP